MAPEQPRPRLETAKTSVSISREWGFCDPLPWSKLEPFRWPEERQDVQLWGYLRITHLAGPSGPGFRKTALDMNSSLWPVKYFSNTDHMRLDCDMLVWGNYHSHHRRTSELWTTTTESWAWTSCRSIHWLLPMCFKTHDTLSLQHPWALQVIMALPSPTLCLSPTSFTQQWQPSVNRLYIMCWSVFQGLLLLFLPMTFLSSIECAIGAFDQYLLLPPIYVVTLCVLPGHS